VTQGAVEVIASEFLAARSATSVCRLPPWRALCRRAPLLERPPERILRMSGPGQVENLCLSGSCIHKASYSGNGQGLSTRSGSCVALLECPFRAHRRHPGASGLPQKSTLRLGPVRYLTPKRRLSCCVNLSIPFSLTVPRLWHAAQHGPTKGRYGWRVDVVLRTTRNRQIAFSLQRSRRGKL
jgi:hypothetical protein